MKYCPQCETPKADDEFAVDRSRDDGLKLICNECNRTNAKRWYEENRAQKIARTLAKRTGNGYVPVPIRRQRKADKEQIAKAAEPDDWQMIRFSQSEWLHCLLEARAVGMEAQEYVRVLVRDDRDRKTRRAFLEAEQKGG